MSTQEDKRNMKRRITRSRLAVLGIVLAFLAASVAPVVGAQSQASVRSVGEFFVDATGRASGENVAASITEAKGVIEGFTSLALDTEVFSSVEIEGFTQAEKMQGVGSSMILLRGSNAVVSVSDNINSVFKIQATADTTVRYTLSEDVTARLDGRHTLDLYADNGAYIGSLVVIGANGAAESGDRILSAAGDVEASLSAGSQVVWHAKPVYVDAEAYNQVIVDAMAEGRLVTNVITEFEGATEHQSRINYFTDVHSETHTTVESTVETHVRSRAQASAMVAYDLAYESLPARNGSDVAMYVNGEAAARAESAAEVREAAEAGLAAYYAFTADGRTQVLASTPDFRSQAEHRLTLAAQSAHEAHTEARAKAEARADAQARAVGAFLLHANGKLTGTFTTSTVSEDRLEVREYRSLENRATIFESVNVGGGAEATARAVKDHQMTLEGPEADLTVVDDAYANLLVEAKQSTHATFDLGARVNAVAESADRIRLEGPNGFTGVLVVAQADASARANAAADAASRLAVTSENQVRAQLEEGARVIFRSNAEGQAYASEDVVAEAIARGEVGAQLLAGVRGEAVATSAIEYAQRVQADVVSSAQGRFEVDYTTHLESATSFVFDTRGTALAAKTASDIQVIVNGQAATAVSTPQAVFEAQGEAVYYVDTALGAGSRVIVNTATSAAATAKVAIESKVESAARASVNKDAFGTFKMFHDGTALGSFVSLRTDEEAGIVHDFRTISSGQTVFTSIAAGASSFVSGGQDGLSQIHLENREADLEFTDTTNAYMKVVAKATTTAEFALAHDVNADAKAAGVVEITNSAGEHIGSLIITDVHGRAAAASSFEITSGNEVKALLEQGTQIIFRTHVGVEGELTAAQRTMLNQAVAAGRVAGQVVVQTQASLSAQAKAAAAAQAEAKATLEATAIDAGTTAVSAVEASGRATTAVTASYYSDVQMVTAATQERVDITVSSATSAGKTVLISLDPSTLEGMRTGDAEILVDGKAAVQAESYADVLNPNDGSGLFKYFVLAGEAGTQVLVSLPHFSTHVVTLKESESSAAPVFMYATLFLSVLVIAETALLVRGRRTV